MKPLCIDLCCGLGGWAEGFLAEGYRCIGFDIERHDYGTGGYPGDLVLQDVLTLHGLQFKDAAVIVASPPCQKYSYMAMPWTRAKKMAEEYRSGVRSIEELNALFNACFRIADEAGVPLIVENVNGAQTWVGPAKWHYGSYYLWGDVPALMPFTGAVKIGTPNRTDQKAIGSDWTMQGVKNPGMDWSGYGKPGYKAEAFNTRSEQAFKTLGHVNKRDGHTHARHLTNQRESDAVRIYPPEEVKNGGDWFGSGENCSLQRRQNSKSDSRKAASAMIAKIPLHLSQWIAKCFKPCVEVGSSRETCISYSDRSLEAEERAETIGSRNGDTKGLAV